MLALAGMLLFFVGVVVSSPVLVLVGMVVLVLAMLSDL